MLLHIYANKPTAFVCVHVSIMCIRTHLEIAQNSHSCQVAAGILVWVRDSTYSWWRSCCRRGWATRGCWCCSYLASTGWTTSSTVSCPAAAVTSRPGASGCRSCPCAVRPPRWGAPTIAGGSLFYPGQHGHQKLNGGQPTRSACRHNIMSTSLVNFTFFYFFFFLYFDNETNNSET